MNKLNSLMDLCDSPFITEGRGLKRWVSAEPLLGSVDSPFITEGRGLKHTINEPYALNGDGFALHH